MNYSDINFKYVSAALAILLIICFFVIYFVVRHLRDVEFRSRIQLSNLLECENRVIRLQQRLHPGIN